MNYRQLYAIRGVNFYYGMASLDFIKGLAAVPMLYNLVPGCAEMVQQVTKAKMAREQAEVDLANAEVALASAIETGIDYHVTLNTHVDAYLKVIQAPGSFLGDGGPVIGPVTPTAVVNEKYEVMEDGKDTPNLNSQIQSVIPNAEKTVEARKNALKAAQDNEIATVNGCITLLCYYEV